MGLRRLVSLDGKCSSKWGTAGHLSLTSGGRRSPTMEEPPFGSVERLAEPSKERPAGEGWPSKRVSLTWGSIALQPRYCRVANVVAPSNIRQRLSLCLTPQRLSDLELGQLWFTPELHSTR